MFLAVKVLCVVSAVVGNRVQHHIHAQDPKDFARPAFMPKSIDAATFWNGQLQIEKDLSGIFAQSSAVESVVKELERGVCGLLEGAQLDMKNVTADLQANMRRSTFSHAGLGDVVNPCKEPGTGTFKLGVLQRMTALFASFKYVPEALTRCFFSLRLARRKGQRPASHCPSEMTLPFEEHLLQKGDAECTVTQDDDALEKCIQNTAGEAIGSKCCTENIESITWYPSPEPVKLPKYGYDFEIGDRCRTNVKPVPECANATARYEVKQGPRTNMTDGQAKIMSTEGGPLYIHCLRPEHRKSCEIPYKDFFDQNALISREGLESHHKLNVNAQLTNWLHRAEQARLSDNEAWDRAMMPWITGIALYSVLPGPFAKAAEHSGFLIASGFSGSTQWFFQVAESLQFSLPSLVALRMALISYMVPYQHSLYEVLLASIGGLQSGLRRCNAKQDYFDSVVKAPLEGLGPAPDAGTKGELEEWLMSRLRALLPSEPDPACMEGNQAMWEMINALSLEHLRQKVRKQIA